MILRALALLLVLAASLRIASTWNEFSETFDEPFHLACGVEWWDHHRYTFERQHPPVARIAIGALPYLAGGARITGQTDAATEGQQLLYSGGDYWGQLRRARMGILPFFWIGCFAVWSLARRWYGPAAGLASLAVFSLLPPILGHAGLATTDLAAAALFALALDRLDAWFARPTRWHLVLAGAATGLAAATKFTNLAYLALALLLLVFHYRRGWRLLPALPIALLVFLLPYRFAKEHDGPRPARLEPGAPLSARAANLVDRIAGLSAFLGPARRGLEEVAAHNREGHAAYLLGRAYTGGDWRFFPVALAVKTPLAVLFLFALAWRRAALLPVALALLLLLPLLFANINLGTRHALHLYVPMAIAAGWALLHSSRWLTIPLAAGLLLGSALSHPHYFDGFNLLAGRTPERILAESDLDWGQDLPALVRLMDAHGFAQCRLSYFGTANADRLYPGRFRAMSWWGEQIPGCAAVSVRYLSLDSAAHMEKFHGDPLEYLRRQPLAGRAGQSILVYNVPAGNP